MPSITTGYLAVLALLYVVLTIRVIRLRAKNRAGFGDGGNPELRSAIRAHAHFAEYVPIIALMIALLEMSGLPAFRVHVLMAGLLVSRLLHPFGMSAEPGCLLHPFGMSAEPGSLRFRVGRGGGVIITLLVMTSSAVSILLRLARGF